MRIDGRRQLRVRIQTEFARKVDQREGGNKKLKNTQASLGEEKQKIKFYGGLWGYPLFDSELTTDQIKKKKKNLVVEQLTKLVGHNLETDVKLIPSLVPRKLWRTRIFSDVKSS